MICRDGLLPSAMLAVEAELNAIREAIYEEIKGMSPSEMNAYMMAKVAPTVEEFGIRVVSGVPVGRRRIDDEPQ